MERLDVEALQQEIRPRRATEELRVIADRLETMRQRLAASFAAEQSFNSAVAHELRTPIAELRALTEAAIKWPARVAPSHALGEGLAIAEHMERVVSTLLALRRDELDGLDLASAEVPLGEMVRDLLLSRQAAAQERRITFALDLAAIDRFDTDPRLLRALVGNLLDNAVTHAPEGGTVTRWSESEAGLTRLNLANPAPDLGVDDLPNLFAAFWRKDPARTGRGHVGLGLTMARSYARVLRLEIAAELEAGQLVITLAQAAVRPEGAGQVARGGGTPTA